MESDNGVYRLKWEDKVLHIQHVGNATKEDVLWVFDQIAAQAAQVGPVDILLDHTQAGSIAPEARKVATQHAAVQHVRYIAIFGFSLVTRAMATLAIRSLMLLSKKNYEVGFFNTASEGRAWIDGMHQRAKR